MCGKEDVRVLGMGNAAIARGALEANVQFATSYPGTPSSEILENLILIAKDWDMYVEWSVNEKVAFEAAMAAAWAGLRALTSMKQNGLFVLLDSLINVAYTGHGQGGLVLVVADDPQAHSSTTEADTRALGHYANIPVIEPSTHQEAKDLMPYMFDLSERYGIPFMMRITTRLAHSQQAFQLGPILRTSKTASFNRDFQLLNIPNPHLRHAELLERLDQIRGRFEVSPWNRYVGPEEPELLVLTSGNGWLYANEAIHLLELEEKVAVLRISTLNPLPLHFIQQTFDAVNKLLFLEEIDPFLETQIQAHTNYETTRNIQFFGKGSGHIPRVGELTIDHTLQAIAKIFKIKYKPVSKTYSASIEAAIQDLPLRPLTFCPGCPHRAAYYAIYQAIQRNGNRGFVTGDIGCYSLGAFYHKLMRNQHAMGTGVGLASGFGRLQRFGLEEPVIAVIGDSTLYHAGLPALVNIYYQQANATICVLDNQATAMTGFQPHPGTPTSISKKPVTPIKIEQILQGIGFPVVVVDPYNIQASIDAVYNAISEPGSHAIIFRRACPLSISHPIPAQKRTRLVIIQEKCLGEKCQICATQFNCPAIRWDEQAGSYAIDTLLCVDCGVCAAICPHGAIQKDEENRQGDD
jgi:indolepyruvate ferredoxin oxidoreductase alpha subunit